MVPGVPRREVPQLKLPWDSAVGANLREMATLSSAEYGRQTLAFTARRGSGAGPRVEGIGQITDREREDPLRQQQDSLAERSVAEDKDNVSIWIVTLGSARRPRKATKQTGYAARTALSKAWVSSLVSPATSALSSKVALYSTSPLSFHRDGVRSRSDKQWSACRPASRSLQLSW